MSTIANHGFRPRQIFTKRVQYIEVLLQSICKPEWPGIHATQTSCKVRVNLGLGYLAPD